MKPGCDFWPLVASDGLERSPGPALDSTVPKLHSIRASSFTAACRDDSGPNDDDKEVLGPDAEADRQEYVRSITKRKGIEQYK